LPSLQQAVEASAEAVDRFKGTAQALGLTLPQAWESLAAAAAKATATVMPHLSNDELEVLRMVLSGWHTWTPEQLHQLRDLEGGLRPLALLDYWKDTTAK